MHAVILAAGDGGRLRPQTAALPKSLLRVAGRPIIDHVLDALAAAGATDATVVTGYEAERLRAAVERRERGGIAVSFVHNEAYHLGNARSIWTAREVVPDAFLLVMGDHIVEPALLRALAAGAGDRCRLAVDRAAAGDPRAADATLALVRDGRVVDLGKGLEHWDALDTGVFWCTPRVLQALTPELRDGEAGALFARLARAGELDAVDVTGARWVDIDTAEDLRRADALLSGEADGRVA